MQRLRNIFNRIIAAVSFFTRLPLWCLCEVPADCYKKVVPLWPLVGWVTGVVTACVMGAASMAFGLPVGIIMALAARVLLTGALHEDGFADFCDGFGGGTTRQRTLEIMKDSHIGTYGVLGLLLYYIMIFATLNSLIPLVGVGVQGISLCTVMPLIISIDAMSKYIGSTILYFLPYARKETEAKNKLVYMQVTWGEKIISLVLGLAPACLLARDILLPFVASCLMGLIVAACLFCMMHRRINGYTGDCCGATFVIVELTMYLTTLAWL